MTEQAFEERMLRQERRSNTLLSLVATLLAGILLMLGGIPWTFGRNVSVSDRYATALEQIVGVQQGSRRDTAWNSDALVPRGRESVATPHEPGQGTREWLNAHRRDVAAAMDDAPPREKP